MRTQAFGRKPSRSFNQFTIVRAAQKGRNGKNLLGLKTICIGLKTFPIKIDSESIFGINLATPIVCDRHPETLRLREPLYVSLCFHHILLHYYH
jgi:hypothetical protein